MPNLSNNSDANWHNYRVYYEDTDAGGVVYYANYLKFFERARTDFLRKLGIIQSQLAQDLGIIFVVRSCNIQYFKPAKIDDLLAVNVAISNIRKTAIIMHQEIKKTDLQGSFKVNDKLISTLDVEIVCIKSDNFKPTIIPQSILNSLNNVR